MKALYDRTQDLQGQGVAAGLAARVAVIFKQYPMLCGFSVQKRSALTRDRAFVRLQGELYLADVSVVTWPGFGVTGEFYSQIAYMLLDLIEEEPGAFDLLHGRTFARTLH